MQYILKLNPFCYIVEATVSSLYMAKGGSMYATKLCCHCRIHHYIQYLAVRLLFTDRVMYIF